MKFAKLEPHVLTSYRSIYNEKNAISKALSRAERLGLSKSEMQPLIIHKAKIWQSFIEAENDIIYNTMDTNLIDFEDGWHGIITSKENGRGCELHVAPFKQGTPFETAFVEMGLKKLKTRKSMDEFFKNYLDKEKLEEYYREVIKKSNRYLRDCYEFTTHVVNNGKEYALTEHCIERWQQRIQQGDKRINIKRREDIVSELSDMFLKSKEVYRSQSTDTSFFFNDESCIFFAVTEDDTIVTVWISTYGFSCEEINKQVTIMQLDYLNKLQKEIIPAKNAVIDEQIKALAKEADDLCMPNFQPIIEDITNKINELQEQLEKTLEEEQSYLNRLKEITENIKVLNDKKNENFDVLIQEENVIFKAHAMIGGGEDANK